MYQGWGWECASTACHPNAASMSSLCCLLHNHPLPIRHLMKRQSLLPRNLLRYWDWGWLLCPTTEGMMGLQLRLLLEHMQCYCYYRIGRLLIGLGKTAT